MPKAFLECLGSLASDLLIPDFTFLVGHREEERQEMVGQLWELSLRSLGPAGGHKHPESGQPIKAVGDVRPQGVFFYFPSSRSEIRLGRSESLKGREEMKRSRKAENVPRSRSDVDMDAAAEAARLHQSASSSASSLSTRWAGLQQSGAGLGPAGWVRRH